MDYCFAESNNFCLYWSRHHDDKAAGQFCCWPRNTAIYIYIWKTRTCIFLVAPTKNTRYWVWLSLKGPLWQILQRAPHSSLNAKVSWPDQWPCTTEMWNWRQPSDLMSLVNKAGVEWRWAHADRCGNETLWGTKSSALLSNTHEKPGRLHNYVKEFFIWPEVNLIRQQLFFFFLEICNSPVIRATCTLCQLNGLW